MARKKRPQVDDIDLTAYTNGYNHKSSVQPPNPLSQIKLEVKCKNETQKKLIQSIKNNDVTICMGPAGTGKSHVSIATALKLLKDNNTTYDSVVLLKSMNQLKGEELPALPGDAMDKMQFQNMSFFDILTDLIGEKYTGDIVNANVIKFSVIGSFRGRNLKRSIIVLDECQNISHDNLKTILTRISENTKIIILGDPEQIDIKNKKDSSLISLVKKVKVNPINGVEVVEFTEGDIVRHRLTSYFLSLFREEVLVKSILTAPLVNKTISSKRPYIRFKSVMINWFRQNFKW